MKRLIAFLMLTVMLLGMVACNGGGAPVETTAPDTVTEPPAPYVPTAADFSIVYASDASKDIKDAAATLKYRIKTEYNVDVTINPETASAYEIALGACRDASTAIKETLGVNSYAIKAVNTANGVCIAVVGNNNRSTLKAIEEFEALLDGKQWSEVLSMNVTDTLDLKYPKKISFYGDSITTYENISDSGLYNSTLVGQAVYYNTERMTRNNMLMTKDETWWGIVLSGLNAKLCVNNSYSGDATTSQYAMNRAKNLHKDFMGKIENPDTIVVYFGINDYHATADSTFRQNYKQLISIIKETYPDATVFCCTLLPRHVDEFKRIEAYNDSIRYVCEELNVELIDFYEMIGADYRANLMLYTIEGCHPFKSGMKVMGDAVVSAIETWYYGE